jgi:hypothetical protein
LDTLGLRTVQVVLWDPALIVGLLRICTGCNSRSISTNNRNLLIGRHSLLGAQRGALGALAALASTLSLGEQGLDPGLVYEVNGSGEGGEEEKVQEDTVSELAEVLGEGLWSTNIWGSKMLVAGSTTLTVSLNAWIW